MPLQLLLERTYEQAMASETVLLILDVQILCAMVHA